LLDWQDICNQLFEEAIHDLLNKYEMKGKK
jgi:hypothetical protein